MNTRNPISSCLEARNPLARIQRYRSFLTKKGVDIKSWCIPPASPKTTALTAMVPRAGQHFQNHTDALSKATQRTLSVHAWTSSSPTVTRDWLSDPAVHWLSGLINISSWWNASKRHFVFVLELVKFGTLQTDFWETFSSNYLCRHTDKTTPNIYSCHTLAKTDYYY